MGFWEKTESKNENIESKLDNKPKDSEIEKALLEITIKKEKTLFNIIVINDDSTITEGEALAKTYTSLSTSYSGDDFKYVLGCESKSSYYNREIQSKEASVQKQAQDINSPIVNNEIQTNQSGEKEQANARHKQEYGHTIVMQEPNLTEKESNYWWRMTNKALKELIYATSGKSNWFLN